MLDQLLEDEGGFVDDPADAGGATNFGITQDTLAEWRNQPVSKQDVKDMTVDEAKAIYVRRYLVGPGYDKVMDESLRMVLFDSAVQFGPDDATRWLQRAAGVGEDGKMGPTTMSAVSFASPLTLAIRVMAHRIRYRGARITKKPSQAKFAAGWADRDGDILEVIA